MATPTQFELFISAIFDYLCVFKSAEFDIKYWKRLVIKVLLKYQAVALINSGSSVYSVSRILGHNSTASVEKTYAHFLQESAEVDLERCMKEAFEKK